jgi:hypothetical protein
MGVGYLLRGEKRKRGGITERLLHFYNGRGGTQGNRGRREKNKLVEWIWGIC